MTFPQTLSVDQLRDGQQFWRLFTEPESSGDIWESDVGALAFAIGADSDIARALITYYDLTETDRVNSLVVSANKPFIGRLATDMSQDYPVNLTAAQTAEGQKLPGRLLISIADTLPQPGWAPAAESPTVQVFVSQPVIDLYQYFAPQPSFLPQRADKIYNITIPKESAATDIWYAFPFYGRRLCRVTGESNGSALSFELFGYNFSDTGDGVTLTTFINQEVAIGMAAAEVTHRETPWDYLAIKITNYTTGDLATVRILTSDEVG